MDGAATKALEQFLIRRFSVVGCMSRANREYLQRNYNLRPSQRVEHFPLWTSRPPYPARSRAETRAIHQLPQQSVVFLFGGQFVPGRGIEDILAAAELVSRESPSVRFLFVGSGPLSKLVESAASSSGSNVTFLAQVSRSEYLAIAASSDVGLVCTVRDVSVPTFPSKSLDYLHAGIPILASVEAASDFGEFVTEHRVGLAVTAGDVVDLAKSVMRLAEDPELRAELARNCSRCLQEKFGSTQAAQRVLNLLHRS
jgi:glycosyltransferase involved in cell wall biosynthesis